MSVLLSIRTSCVSFRVLFFLLDLQVLPFANAFYRGLTDLISPSWLNIFTAKEFNQVATSAFLINVDK